MAPNGIDPFIQVSSLRFIPPIVRGLRGSKFFRRSAQEVFRATFGRRGFCAGVALGLEELPDLDADIAPCRESAGGSLWPVQTSSSEFALRAFEWRFSKFWLIQMIQNRTHDC